ncbi:hypothetical protein ES705_42465 [subsurface metagenome]
MWGFGGNTKAKVTPKISNMAHIEERKIKSGSQYRLIKSHRENGKVKHIRFYLGTKDPLPKGMPRTNLPANWIERLERKARQRAIKPPPNPILPNGKFSVIYADPPWRYEFSETESRSIEAHYNTLSLEEICKYKDGNGTPVQEKFADDAVLFLWATQPKIREALQVIEAWGFNYRTGAIWLKDKFGMGYYFREQHELLFIAKRGDIPVPSPKARPPSIIRARRTNHSQKPREVYKIIQKMYPCDRYLEIFGREKYSDKWEVVGLEV